MRRPALYLHGVQSFSTRRSRARERLESFCYGAIGMIAAVTAFLFFI